MYQEQMINLALEELQIGFVQETIYLLHLREVFLPYQCHSSKPEYNGTKVLRVDIPKTPIF